MSTVSPESDILEYWGRAFIHRSNAPVLLYVADYTANLTAVCRTIDYTSRK